MAINQPEPLDGTEWKEETKDAWFCGVYRYRFDCEAIIRLNENNRFEWSMRLITDADGTPEVEASGDYASLLRTSHKIQAVFAEWMERPSVQGDQHCRLKGSDSLQTR